MAADLSENYELSRGDKRDCVAGGLIVQSPLGKGDAVLKEDLTGRRFGRLLVLGFSKCVPGRSSFWKCRCDCGREKEVNRNCLLHKREPTKSCGCLQPEAARRNARHGLHQAKIYKQWTSMKQRCLNPMNPSFPDYGGRGIKVCRRWMKFENFLADMGNPPNIGQRPGGLYLERVDNDKGYGPRNCKWASPSEQLLNRRNSIHIKGKPLLVWCEQKGFSYPVALCRFHRGLSFKDIFKPYKKRYRGSRSV